MKIEIRIPTALRQYAKGNATVSVQATNVGEALAGLTTQLPELRKHLYDEKGALRSFVNVYLDGQDVRYLQQGKTPVKDGDTLVVVPAVAGGQAGGSGSSREAGGDRAAHGDMGRLASQGAPPLPRGPGGPAPPSVALSHAEIRRYSRHLIMPDVGMEGQRKLKSASVLCIGTGGLGSPIALYLAAAGVGRVGLVDFDVVDESNLQRQVLFDTTSVGKSKAQAARDRLLALNPNVRVDVHEEKLTSENALRIFRDYDVIVDGTDNFPTRYLTNDACVLLGKPNVYGSIFQFEGQVTVFWAEKGPCYRCLYAQPPPPGLVPSCAEGGVLGILPGVVGTLQATEAIKLLIGKGEPLIGRLLLYDALGLRFTELKLKKNPSCPACGTKEITKLIDYEEFCGIRGEETLRSAPAGGIPQITPAELKAQLDAGKKVKLVDVRNPNEWEICRIEGATLIPLPQFAERVNELSTADEIVVHCHHGPRSMQATSFLLQMGFKKVKNLYGGIDAWAQEIDPEMARY